jgi:hypothetical protein
MVLLLRVDKNYLIVLSRPPASAPTRRQMAVVQKAVEHCRHRCGVGQQFRPIIHWSISI